MPVHWRGADCVALVLRRVAPIAALALMAYAECASAQQTSSPLERALSLKLWSEVNAGLQCSVAAVGLEQELVSARAQVKALQDKYEPAAPPKKPE